MESTEEQKEIINSDAGHLLVIAGAGSGKTTTLIQRIQRLIREKKAGPQSILGLTFTVKASLELAKKSAEESKSRDEDGAIRVQTYDSFVQEIVRHYGLLIGVDPSTVPLSDAGICQCIADVMEENAARVNDCFNEVEEEDPDYTLPSLTPYANSYSKSKPDLQTAIKNFTAHVLNFLVDEEHLSFNEAVKPTEDWNESWIESLQQILKNGEPKNDETVNNLKTLLCAAKLRGLVISLSKQYAALKEKQALAEYGDFTVYALKLVCAFPSIAQDYAKYKYVFLDEYQDTNHTQGILMKLLFEGTNVTAVGDPQQAIYGFRGSTPGAFPYFRKGFHTGKAEGDELSLSKTFRNKRNVAELANRITGKHLAPEERQDLESADPKDAEISVFAFKGASEGLRAVWKFVENEREKGNGKIAVLGRKNKDLQPYKDFLEEKGIPCRLTGNIVFNDENPIARDLKDFLSVCSDPFAAKQAEDLLTSPRYGLPLGGLRELAYKVKEKNRELNESLHGGKNEKQGENAHHDPLITLPVYLMEDLELPYSEGVLERFRRDLQSVMEVMAQGIEETAIAAWKALDFDSDIGVAEALLKKLPYPKLTLEDVLKAVKAYEADLASNQTATLQGFLGWLENYEISAGRDESADDMVEIMTIHQAKGLEWGGVAVVGMEKIPEKQKEDFNRGGFENEKGKKRDGKAKNSTADAYWKGTWINSYDSVPGNMRVDLKDLGEKYRKACGRFNNPEECETVHDLSGRIDELCEAEIERDEVEEAHTAYVAVTRSGGDLLLVSKIAGNAGFTHGNLNNSAHMGMFWMDAARFLGKEWEEKEITGEKTHGFAIRSAGGRFKEAIENELKETQDKAEDEYAWPLQIKEGLRRILKQSRDRVQAAPKPVGSQSGLRGKAGEVLKFHQSLSQPKKSLEEQFNELKKDKPFPATFVQWLANNTAAAMQSVIRPMPHGSAAKAEAGTEFHAWVKTHLLTPSDEGQCKIKGEYKEEFSRWKEIFLASEWNAREPFCAEEPFTVRIPGLAAAVTAIPDAVFRGGLKGDNLDSKLTVVDWKTGEIPKTEDEKNRRLLQLEIYRLVLSRAWNKDINDIDACLYYFSEGGCQIPLLQPMDEEDIVKKITSIEGMQALSNEAEEEA